MAEQLEPGKANHVAIFGRKGSGKSELGRAFWDSYPYDRLVIDPTGDFDPGDPDAVALTVPLPHRWPLNPLKPEERSTLRFIPDMGAPTYVNDMDEAVGLAFRHGGESKPHPHKRCLLMVDEVGELTSANATPPAMRRTLHQSRHRGMSTIFAGPRPIDINKLVITQADYIGVFDLPDEADRKRVASVMGFDFPDFEAAHRDLLSRGPHWHLWFDAKTRELQLRPPIPLRGDKPRTGRRYETEDVG